uniref:Fe2OG dioxygenase domain-containing protein n=1 Tax=Cucumis sativus TaxID=3659 RepID=A0A0A0K8Y2_CUCSA
MVCEAKSKVVIPIIDLSKLEEGTKEWGLACREMRFGLEQFGCFSVVYDKVSLELHNSIFEATKELFHLPIETRMKNTSEKPYHGYFGGYSFLPLYESMAIDNPIQLQPTQSFANLMWPTTENNHFCVAVERFSTLVAKLEHMVTKMVLESYGVSNKVVSEPIMESTNYLLRLFKYRVAEKDENDVGLHSHTDLTFLSIIHQHLISGLQIQLLDDQWLEVHPSSHCSFTVMAGDALMVTTHQSFLFVFFSHKI